MEDATPDADPYADRPTDYTEGEEALYSSSSEVGADREAVPALT